MGRRIGGAPGGSDKAKPTLALTIGGITVGATVVLSPGGVSLSDVSIAKARAGSRAAKAEFDASKIRLSLKGLKVRGDRSDDGTDCVGHAYGQVREFFREHPCAGLDRSYVEVGTDRGGLALVAVSWVQMPDADSARTYKALVDAPRTGNVTELSRERGDHRSLRFTGCTYTSFRHDTTVANAQAEPVTGSAAGLVLTELVHDVLVAGGAQTGRPCT